MIAQHTRGKAWRYGVLVGAVLLLLAGAAWAFRDQLRSPQALYQEALSASPRRASQLYAVLEARSPELAEYWRLWSSQALMPSLDAVAGLHHVIAYRPDSPAAYHARLTLARYYARIESPETVAQYRAALALRDSVEVSLELARYLEAQNALSAAYNQYAASLGRLRPDAFADMRRTASSPLVVAKDLLGRHFYTDVIDILRDEEGCEARCVRAEALKALGDAEAAATEAQACQACSGTSAPASIPEEGAPMDERQRLLASPDPVDWWRATWDMDVAATLSGTMPISEVLPIYLKIANSNVYVSDDAAYRAWVLARRQGDAQAEQQALALLEEATPSWLAHRATGEPGLELAPDYESLPADTLAPAVMGKVAALQALGRRDLAIEELSFAARVSETPEVIVRMAQELEARGRVTEAYTLGSSLLRSHPYLPLAAWKLAYPQAYAADVTRWAAEYGVDPLLIWAVMRQESEFRTDVTSSAGAMGLMQVMPALVEDANAALGTEYALGDAHIPTVGIRLGARELGRLLQHFEGDANLALMGYNAGPGNVDAWLQEPTGQNEDDLLRFVPFGETREYVARVALNYLIYRTLYAAP